MPIENFLAEEDAKAYREARDMEEPSKLSMLEEEPPDWQEQLEVMKYQRYTQNPPGLPDLLATSVFNKDQGGAAQRRFGDDLDLSYLNPDGTFNQTLWKQDNFVLDVERAYYENRGQIPLEWFMEYADDLEFLGGEFADSAQQLHRLALLQSERQNAREYEVSRFNRDIEFIAEWQEIGRGDANAAYLNIDAIINSYGEDWERGQQALDEILGTDTDQFGQLEHKASYRDLYAMREVREVRTPIKAGWEYTKDEMVLNAGGEYVARAAGEPAQEGDTRVTLRRSGYQELSDRRGDLAAAQNLMAEAIGMPMGWIVGSVGWGIDTLGSGIQLDKFIQEAGSVLANPEEGRLAAVAEMEDQLGLTDTQFVVQAGIGGAIEMWRNLPTMDPATHQMYLAMAGGDQGLAQDLFADAMLFSAENEAHNKKQREIYDAKLRYQIQELENKNFTTSDAIMGIISAWGEAMEFAATAVTLGAKEIFTGNVPEVNNAQFWQDVRDAETPSGVLGLDGTLTGLIFDLGATMAIDPTTYIFGPKLAAGGRAGATTVDDAVRIADNAASELIRREVVDVGRGHSSNAIGYAAVMDNLATTGYAESYLAATRGFSQPLTGVRPYLDTPIAAAVDDVSYHLLNTIHDDVVEQGLMTEGLEAATEHAIARGVQPVEVTYNPATRKAAITKNSQTRAILQGRGIDAIPTYIKVDPDFGVNVYKQIKGMSDEASIRVNQIADGTIEKQLNEAKRVVKEDRKAVDKMVTRADEALGYAPDPELEAIFGPREVKELGTVMSKNGNTLRVQRVEQAGNIDYLVYDADQGGVGAAMGGVAIVDDQITMGLKPRARGAMEQIWDLAAKEGDDLLAIHGESPSTSQAAIDFAKRYAKKKVDASDTEIRVTDESVKATDVDWQAFSFDDTVDMDGVRGIRPRRAIGDEIYGDVDFDMLKELEVQHMLAGGDAVSGQRTIVGISAAQYAGDLIRSSESKFFSRIGEFITPINSNFHFSFNGPAAMSQISQFGNRLWASARDHIGFEPYQARILDFYKRRGQYQLQANRLTTEVAEVRARHQAMGEFIGGTLDDWVERLGLEKADPEMAKRHRQVTDELAKVEKELDSLRAQQQTLQAKMTDYQGLNTIMDEMMDDFNRRHIATNKQWSDVVDPETGMVPWDVISNRTYGEGTRRMRAALEQAAERGLSVEQLAKGEAGYIPAEVAKALDEAIEQGLPTNTFISDALAVLNSKSFWNAPASPLELMAAAGGGPSMLKRVQHRVLGEHVMEAARNAQMYWALDKVMTPRTAVVVSLDELTRIAHLGGSKSVLQLAEDKAISVARRSGQYNRMPSRWKDRLTRLEEYPTFYRQLERSFLETNGYGFDTIEFKKGPGAAQYYEAAQRTTGQLLTDRGFQKFFEGEDAFREWFDTDTEAASLRSMEFLDPAAEGVRTGMTADMALAYYDSIFENWALSKVKAGKKGEARRIWAEAAAEQAAKGSTAGGPITLPDWVLEGFGSVTGNARINRRGMGAFNMASDILFQQPVNYRRGFLAEWTRKAERARLKKLFDNQGKRVLSADEVRDLIKREHPTWGDDLVEARKPSMEQELFERHNIITQSYVDELVEQKVITEMENTLYSFQMNSAGGKAAKVVAPFGKPYADMMGFWGRELISRPNLRGWINDANYMNMGEIANKVADQMPFNPKAAAFISRIAATDFDLERIGDDPNPLVSGLANAVGLEELDVGPALFLPHQGNNPFGVLLPGLGVIPVGALHVVFNHLSPDPVDNPLEYQQWVDTWSQILPGVGYNQGNDLLQGIAQLVLGGGTVSKLNQGISAVGSIAGSSQPSANAINGSWGGAVEANRRVKTIFQDANIWEEFADLPEGLTAEGFTAWLDSKLEETVESAQTSQALRQIGELATEISVPVRADYGAANDQLNDVWMESIGWMEKELPRYIDPSTEAGKRQAADWARSQFFALPDWHRDALVAENPALAVNMVSMWEWTDKAKNAKRMINQTGQPYRSGGSSADLARHETYQQLGYIKPVTPAALAKNIVGTIVNAKVQTARTLYTDAVKGVNEQRWEHNVSDEWKQWLDETARTLSANNVLPYRTGRELWANYSDLKGEMDIAFPPGEGETGFAMPTKMRAWGESMPSSPDALREELREGYPIPIVTDEMRTMARALGLRLEPGSTPNAGALEMGQLYQAVADAIATDYLDNPIYAHVAADYKAWNSPRSAGAQATQEFFGRVLDSSAFSDDIRWSHKKNLIFIDEVMERRAINDPSWLELRDVAVDRYMAMMQDDAFEGADAKKLWDQAYGKSLGALDWEPPEPAPLLMPNGQPNPDASRVYVARVVDGDTIDFTFGGGIVGNQYNRLRLLGYNAAELGQGGEEERDSLRTAIQDAIEQGLPISVVRDPRFGNTDMYGRMYGWLYIGDEPWYNADTMIPRND